MQQLHGEIITTAGAFVLPENNFSSAISLSSWGQGGRAYYAMHWRLPLHLGS